MWGEILARRNHHPEKLASQELLRQRLQRDGEGEAEERETIMNRHKTEWLDLRRMDNMLLMREFPDKHFDLAIVDPPYGIGSWSGGQKSGNTISIEQVEKINNWDKCTPDAAYFAELRRVSLNQVVWGGNYFFDHLGNARHIAIWNKMIRRMHLSDGELAWTSFEGSAMRIFDMHRSQCDAHGTDRIHPTQKPVALYRWLLANYAKPGQKILDTHLGSGSIAIACHYARIHLTACELDADYFAASIARIKRETAQESFDFDAAPPAI